MFRKAGGLFCSTRGSKKMTFENKKIITILGPTASGKSSLGIALAREFDGEIASADSRQVYRGLDIGTGKVTPDEQRLVPHHLLDVVEPMEDFSVAHFQKLAFAAIDDIIKRGKLPFLAGGTALYIYAIVDNYNLSDVGANPQRRKELEKMSVDELHVILSEASRRRAESKDLEVEPETPRQARGDGLNESDLQNPRRLIRAIEKLEAGASLRANKKPARYSTAWDRYTATRTLQKNRPADRRKIKTRND